MIAVNNTTTNQSTNKNAKPISSTEHVMANTMSVDEYFDELISQVRKDYADL